MASLVAGCASEAAQRAPVAPDDGIELTGTLRGQRISVTDGEPEVLFGDCDAGDGRDVDLCIVTFTIDGEPLGLVIENPSALRTGESLPVVAPGPLGCLPHCDEVRAGVVVELRSAQERQFATFGRFEPTRVGDRFAASFVVEVGGGRVSGGFNVAPAPPP